MRLDQRTLLLNADYQPLSYYPLSTLSWQDAIKRVIEDKVDVLEEYDVVVRSPSYEVLMPAVIALRNYQYIHTKPLFSRHNIFLRDGYTCQYCNKEFHTKDLTFDHILPVSKGGGTSWINITTACMNCNLKKGNKSIKASKLKILKHPLNQLNHS